MASTGQKSIYAIRCSRLTETQTIGTGESVVTHRYAYSQLRRKGCASSNHDATHRGCPYLICHHILRLTPHSLGNDGQNLTLSDGLHSDAEKVERWKRCTRSLGEKTTVAPDLKSRPKEWRHFPLGRSCRSKDVLTVEHSWHDSPVQDPGQKVLHREDCRSLVWSKAFATTSLQVKLHTGTEGMAGSSQLRVRIDNRRGCGSCDLGPVNNEVLHVAEGDEQNIISLQRKV